MDWAHVNKQWGVMDCVYNPSAGEVETGGSLRLTGLHLWASGSRENTEPEGKHWMFISEMLDALEKVNATLCTTQQKGKVLG